MPEKDDVRHIVQMCQYFTLRKQNQKDNSVQAVGPVENQIQFSNVKKINIFVVSSICHRVDCFSIRLIISIRKN
jgi:hypothetical protein